MTAHLVAVLEELIQAPSSGAVRRLLVPGTSLESLAPLTAAGPVEVRWLFENEGRVDAGVIGAAREWRIACFLAADGRVATVDVYERPPVFEGVPGGRALVVNGPSGAGKSTLLDAVLERADTPWVVFDEPWLGRTRQPYLIWRDAAPLLHKGFLDGIAALAATGNQVALAAAGHPAAAVMGALAGVRVLSVGLDCPLEVLLRRERGRPGRAGGLAASSPDIHDGWSYDLRFDTSVTPPDRLAGEVLAALAGGTT